MNSRNGFLFGVNIFYDKQVFVNHTLTTLFEKRFTISFWDQGSVPQFSQLFQILKGSSRSRIAGSKFSQTVH